MDDKGMLTNDALGAKLDAVGQRMEKVELKIDGLSNTYVASNIFDLHLKEFDTRIEAIKLEISQMWMKIKKDQKTGKIQSTVVGIVSAAAGVILALLIEFYLAHVGKS